MTYQLTLYRDRGKQHHLPPGCDLCTTGAKQHATAAPNNNCRLTPYETQQKKESRPTFFDPRRTFYLHAITISLWVDGTHNTASYRCRHKEKRQPVLTKTARQVHAPLLVVCVWTHEGNVCLLALHCLHGMKAFVARLSLKNMNTNQGGGRGVRTKTDR